MPAKEQNEENELAEKVMDILVKINKQSEATAESSNLYDQLATTLDRLIVLRATRNDRWYNRGF